MRITKNELPAQQSREVSKKQLSFPI